MNTKTYLSIVGVVISCVAGLGLAYQLDQGNISLGDDAELSESVSGSPESFEFEAESGREIMITITDTQDAPYRGSFELQDPDGNDVLSGGPRAAEIASRSYVTEQSGTYRLVVNPQSTQVNVNVHIDEP